MTNPTPPVPPQGPPAIPQDYVISIALSVAQINYVLGCLGQRPHVEVQQLIDSIRGQGDMALAAAGYGPNAKPPGTPPAPLSEDPPGSNSPDKAADSKDPPRKTGARRH